MQKIQAFITDQLTHLWASQRNNLFLWTPFFFAVGIAIYFGLSNEPNTRLSITLLIASITGVIFLYKRQDDHIFNKYTFLALVAFAFMFAGFNAALLRANNVYTPMLVKKIKTTSIIGTIESLEKLEARQGSRIILKELEIERLSIDKTPRKIRLKIRKDNGLKVGQRIEILGSLNPAGGPVKPGAFDFQRMAYFQSIGGVGFAYTQPNILEDSKTKPSLLSIIRQSITDKVVTQTSSPEQSVVVALMTGQRGAITDDNWTALRVSGLAHLLAISGLHVGMVAGVLFFFSRLLMACIPTLALNYPIKKWAAFFALIGALFYTLLVGATVPTQRAMIMTAFIMIAIIFDRSPFSMRMVALAALLVLAFSPESLTSVSFQMSFAAVVSLIYFYDLIRPYWRSVHSKAGILRKAALYFIGVSLTTIVAGTATGLFSLYHFQNYAVYGVIANLVAVPLMGFLIMPFIVLSYLLMLFGLEATALNLIEWAVGWVLATAHWVANMEGASWHIAQFPHWIFIAMVCCLWFWVVWIGSFKRIIVPIFIALIFLISVYKQADILVSSKVDVIALRDINGSYRYSTIKNARYSSDQWQRLNGQANEKKLKWPKEGRFKNFPLMCDYYGCRGEIDNQKLAISFNDRGWKEDCAWADILISQVPVNDRKCRAETVIDFFDVWRNGPYALWFSEDKIKIKTVEGIRGKRLWTQTAANNKSHTF